MAADKPGTPPIVTAADPALVEANDALARAEAAVDARIASIDLSESFGAAFPAWSLPDRYKQAYADWTFVRCGVRKPDGSLTAVTADVYRTLREQGYQDAPNGTVCLAALSDGDRGVYVCIPNHLRRKLIEHREEMKRRRDVGYAGMKRALMELDGIKGIHVEDFKTSTETVSWERDSRGRRR